MKYQRGFSLVELLVYAAIFAIVTGVLTGILVVGTRTQTREKAGGEVNQQLSLILTTVERLVRQSSLIEKVYEGTDEGVACTTFCSLKLRMSDASLDPTVIRSDANGVYLKQGAGAEVTLTTSRVVVNSLTFTKYEIAGAHATVQMDATLTYNSSNPQLAISKTIQSAIARVSAATFDADLLPNTDNTYSIGQLAPDLRWKNGRLSGDLTVAGNVGIGTTSPSVSLHVVSSGTSAVRILGSGGSLDAVAAALQVAGGLSGTSYGGYFTERGSGTNIGIYASAEGSGTNYAAIFNSGNVGIGTTSPTAVLTVASGRLQATGGALPSGGTGMEIGHDGTTGFVTSINRGTSVYKDLQIAASTTLFNIGLSEKMRLNSTGLGIGTTAPQSKLHIEGASGWLILDEQDTNPTATELDANDSIAIYTKGNILVIAFNNAGTITYLKIALDGSTTTWTQGTGAP
ncbi:MAG: prepilin-type N-terminal cleavage/methylation domain-containing protein [Candidatus Colwellbacteria bacterium]|nr:prepilin-type N-terminal cleavage/methylation domain-containing protein [Candidatus Colwellbacteria bacterium]